MKENRNIMLGWILLLFAAVLFCLQLAYMFAHANYQVEYTDSRLFYVLNILCVVFLYFALSLLLKKFMKTILAVLSTILLVQIGLLVHVNQEVRNIVSISPNKQHVFSAKENLKSGEFVYYRTNYGIFARPKEVLPKNIVGEVKVEWLANDIAALTYQSTENKTEHFVATYGDRKDGISYYNVGAEIHGVWQGSNLEVTSGSEGISVKENNVAELFKWKDIQQYGTQAVVLKRNKEPIWTISLNENFVVQSDSTGPMVGNISLCKVTMDQVVPVTLQFIQ
ncbi:hypothetical protein [Robertmurraya kyonggiensis]|uniref:Uncharacterized protein n=1 Tax=Robertmurraya kyonggiensis TaxID=1037680 RepID=A0A4U1DBZ3_9BACI|nr:hypothetical protein [Robertmurraya kyonggiensis]TKC19016.1 hypothetical protein FA727_05575 [Robertmurraya kyonggiensis]